MGKRMGAWVHAVTVYSAKEKKVRFYVDGTFNVKKSDGNPAVFDKVGVSGWDGKKQFEGMTDKSLVFESALNYEDIQTLVSNGLGKALSV